MKRTAVLETHSAKRNRGIGTSLTLAALQKENKVVMLRLYALLSTFDRLSLRQVSKAFYKDKRLCHTLTRVYGPDNVDVFQALEQVEEYLDFSTTPECLELDDYLLPPWWQELSDDGDDLYGQVRGAYNAANGGSYRLGGFDRSVKKSLEKINKFRRRTQRQLARIRDLVAVYESSGSAPYNLLFKLLRVAELPWTIFWNARRNPHQEGGNFEYQIIRNGGEPEYISHLRPGVKIVFDNGSGGVETRVIKKCDRCRKIKDDVVSERCGKAVGSLECFHEKSVCRKCTTRGTCSTCGGTFCMDDVHGANLVQCSAPGCKNLMCHAGSERFFDVRSPEWHDTICSYKLSGKIYCVEHKPEGASPYIDSEKLNLRRLYLEHKKS